MSVLMNSSLEAMTIASFFNCLFAASSESCNSFWCATAASFSAATFSSSAVSFSISALHLSPVKIRSSMRRVYDRIGSIASFEPHAIDAATHGRLPCLLT